MITHDFVIHVGEEFNETLKLIQNGKIINLTNRTGMAQIRPEQKSKTLTATMTVTIPQPTSGRINLRLTAAQTKLIAPGTYYYDVCTKQGSVVIFYIQGKFIVKPDVSRY